MIVTITTFHLKCAASLEEMTKVFQGTAPKYQNLWKSGKTISTKLDCPSPDAFMNLVAVPARCAVRLHHVPALLEA